MATWNVSLSSKPSSPPAIECQLFQRGRCHYGEQCKYLHVPPANSINPPTPTSSARPLHAPLSDYPVRSNAADCQYYLKTGKCNYGARCKFNHPFRDENLVNAINRRDCFDFVQRGVCPYGNSCKYNHPPATNLITSYHLSPTAPRPTRGRHRRSLSEPRPSPRSNNAGQLAPQSPDAELPPTRPAPNAWACSNPAVRLAPTSVPRVEQEQSPVPMVESVLQPSQVENTEEKPHVSWIESEKHVSNLAMLSTWRIWGEDFASNSEKAPNSAHRRTQSVGGIAGLESLRLGENSAQKWTSDVGSAISSLDLGTSMWELEKASKERMQPVGSKIYEERSRPAGLFNEVERGFDPMRYSSSVIGDEESMWKSDEVRPAFGPALFGMQSRSQGWARR